MIIISLFNYILCRYADEMIDYPDLQLVFSSSSDYGPLSARFNAVNSKTASSLYKNITNNVQAFGILPFILRPRSKGFIKLESSDPKVAPTNVPNYFKDPYDLQVLVCYIHLYTFTAYIFIHIKVIHNCLLALLDKLKIRKNILLSFNTVT